MKRQQTLLNKTEFFVHRDAQGLLFLYLDLGRAGRHRLLQLNDHHPVGIGVEPDGDFEPITLVRVSKFEGMKRALDIYDKGG